MKTKLPTLAIGFVLGVLSILLLGQSKPPQPAVPGRYTMVSTPIGICVQDTATGAVKIIPTGYLETASQVANAQAFKHTGGLFAGEPFETTQIVPVKSP